MSARTGPLARLGGVAIRPGCRSSHTAVFAASAIVSASLDSRGPHGTAPWTALLAWILVQAGVVAIWRPGSGPRWPASMRPAYDLGLMAELLARLEVEPFESSRLAAVRARARRRRHPAVAPHRAPPAAGDLPRSGDAQSVVQAVRARCCCVRQPDGGRHRSMACGLRSGGRAVAAGGRRVEALAALATYAYEHPADPFPAIVDAGPLFDATALGHPLIDERVGVRNDVRLGDGHPRALIVSGSNMSGKSTLLRGVGVNVVLALAGAPVRAADLTLSRLAIGCDDAHRRFAAGRALAVLRGDSAHPDHRRSRARADAAAVSARRDPRRHQLARSAHRRGSDRPRPGRRRRDRPGDDARSGADGAGVEAGRVRVANVHFEDRIEDGKMVFDYRCGPASSSGATRWR